jgi:hypothetical protein
MLSRWLDEVSLPCGGLELDQIVSFASGLHRLAAAILDGDRSDAGADNSAFAAPLGVDGNRAGFSLTPIT